jgi:chromatin remodeling complex protein RSC6
MEDTKSSSEFDALQHSLTKFKVYITEMQQQLRALEKSVKEKEQKPSKTTRPPKIIGFDIPEKITPELCAFMKLPAESMATRNAVTSYITEYIRTHKLQDMTDRKCIHLDKEMEAVFKTTQMTYFNMHKYISSTFGKGAAKS